MTFILLATLDAVVGGSSGATAVTATGALGVSPRQCVLHPTLPAGGS